MKPSNGTLLQATLCPPTHKRLCKGVCTAWGKLLAGLGYFCPHCPQSWDQEFYPLPFSGCLASWLDHHLPASFTTRRVFGSVTRAARGQAGGGCAGDFPTGPLRSTHFLPEAGLGIAGLLLHMLLGASTAWTTLEVRGREGDRDRVISPDYMTVTCAHL